MRAGLGRAPAAGGLGDRGEGPGRVEPLVSRPAPLLRRSSSSRRERVRDEAGVAGRVVRASSRPRPVFVA